MARALTIERLAATTLRRQFPRLRGRRQPALVELMRRLGPVQTQVPRAIFLFAAARLPGVRHEDVVAAFEAERLVKGSNLRGTVHTSTREQHALLDAVSRRPRSLMMRTRLGLEQVTAEQVGAQVERLAGDWVERADLVQRFGHWLSDQEGRDATVTTSAAANLVWGHSALVRRPPDRRWHTRTDTLHRRLHADGSRPADVATAHAQLVRQHLGAFGPASRRDVAWWMGVRLGDVDGALQRLGDEVVPLTGPDGAALLDLAEPPRGGHDPGTVLLPEYDGLLVGYEGPGRDRFLDRRHLPLIWQKVNGLFLPGVLHDGRIVGTWRLVAAARRSPARIEVTPFERVAGLDEAALAPSAEAVATVLAMEAPDIRVLAP